jgi:hypothetical protein
MTRVGGAGEGTELRPDNRAAPRLDSAGVFVPWHGNAGWHPPELQLSFPSSKHPARRLPVAGRIGYPSIQGTSRAPERARR